MSKILKLFVELVKSVIEGIRKAGNSDQLFTVPKVFRF